jgi:hypothetical protein
MIPHLKKIYSNDFEVNRLQSNVAEILDALTSSEFVNGTFIKKTILTTDTVIEHKLQREYEGWVVTDIDGSAIIYRSSTTNNFKQRQLILKASVQVNATIYIF